MRTPFPICRPPSASGCSTQRPRIASEAPRDLAFPAARRDPRTVTAGERQETSALTFVFTDIEGSTRTWEHAPHAMDGWLATHDRLLTEQALGATIGR